MRLNGNDIQFSATDVAKHLACRHLTALDLLAAKAEIKRPYRDDPTLTVLEDRGRRHEAAYLAYLKDQGKDVLLDETSLAGDARLRRTVEAMKSGIGAIAQADLKDGRWFGRADVLLKVERPSKLGNWSYEIVDTKLAHETRGGTILQLCLYCELVAGIQGFIPGRMHVITPERQFQPETFRPNDFLAYYRLIKSRLESAVAGSDILSTYPEPAEHCEVCEWWPPCNDRRRKDDHLSFVAGISKPQIGELRSWEINTLSGLATMPLPLEHKPQRGAVEGYVKVREQARVQFEYREIGKPVHELLALEPERGLARLPEPCPGDVFLDFEADPFVEGGGLEYLLGYVTRRAAGQPEYRAMWAFDRPAERKIFESFVDDVIERWATYPALHIYHFSPYEPSALKRLMGRYATREDEIDRMLRAGIFVDLHRVVRQALRASVERYSLKDLEVFFGFERKTDLREASKNLRSMECALELNESATVPAEVLNTVQAYNEEDCLSTLRLRDWLEEVRQDLVSTGKQIDRPSSQPSEPSEAVSKRRHKALRLMEGLLKDVPDEPSQRTPLQQAKWLLAHMMEFHHREEKVPWWEYFRLCGLSEEELFEEDCAISGLEFVGRQPGGTARCPIDRYRFPKQDIQVRREDELNMRDSKVGNVVAIDTAHRTIDVKKTSEMAEIHPKSVFVHTVVKGGALVESLFRLASWVIDHGIEDPDPQHRSARDLLLRNPPRLNATAPTPLYDPKADIVVEARRLALDLDHGVLPIQGPPGAGKTYTGARMICELLRAGKKVGVTSVSHKVIRKLLEETLDVAKQEGISVGCFEKVKEKPKRPHAAITEVTANNKVIDALNVGTSNLAGGTAWLWARPEFERSVDVLFVDEAGQMSLPDVLAVAQAADSIVLLGDPQQLEQPLRGTHPPGVDSSALQHILGQHETIAPEAGLFLNETWRLSPAICQFTSELFYENRLKPHSGLEAQALKSPTPFAGEGLWFVPVGHEGNQNRSDEEAEVVEKIVKELLGSGTSWLDMKGIESPIDENDILIVAPYNAQVFNIADRLPKCRVGTVDKFQGQEAPIVIYSMATSSPEDAPRGMEFLYSINRFNVASSRARCACILIANPQLFEPECQTPRQMKLANILCRYLEMATTIH